MLAEATDGGRGKGAPTALVCRGPGTTNVIADGFMVRPRTVKAEDSGRP